MRNQSYTLSSGMSISHCSKVYNFSCCFGYIQTCFVYLIGLWPLGLGMCKLQLSTYLSFNDFRNLECTVQLILCLVQEKQNLLIPCLKLWFPFDVMAASGFSLVLVTLSYIMQFSVDNCLKVSGYLWYVFV